MRTTTSNSTIVGVIKRGWIGAAVLLAACGGGGAGGSGPDLVPAPVEQALPSYTDCEDLRAAIIEDAREKIAVEAEGLRAAGFFGDGGAPSPAATPAASPTSAPGAEGPDGPDDFTDTNTQVPDVDEADVVETDGTHLYLLHGSELLVLDSWPPEATALRSRLAIEGAPLGMFVSGTRGLVASSVLDEGDLVGPGGCPLPIGGPIVTSEPSPTASPPRCFTSFTKLTLVDLAGEAPRVVREIYLEGSYTSARRHGNLARVVVQRSSLRPATVPGTGAIWNPSSTSREEHVARVDAWEGRATAALDATEVADWLPVRRERRGGSLVGGTPACDDVRVPPPGSSGDGTTQIFAIDMTQDDGVVGDAIVLGYTAEVYANADTLVLAQPDWGFRISDDTDTSDDGETSDDADTNDEASDRTALHVFALASDSAETTYLASGFVPGRLISQFALDVSGDVIRVATTITPDAVFPNFGEMVSRITALRVEGETLVAIGATPDLAPGESIFAVRFLGTRAYLVTFRFVDPLFVIDLADPANPVVLGELELPGFSEYIHPLGESRLLTIGSDADASGFTRGVAIRTFDVSDPTAPRLTDIEALPGEGWSAAQTNHLVFTFDAGRGLLALPYSRFASGFDAPPSSSLVLVSVDAAGGLDIRGEIAHDAVPDDPCEFFAPCVPQTQMERGLFIEDWVYSISSASVLVNAVSDLAPVAEVNLPMTLAPPPDSSVP